MRSLRKFIDDTKKSLSTIGPEAAISAMNQAEKELKAKIKDRPHDHYWEHDFWHESRLDLATEQLYDAITKEYSHELSMYEFKLSLHKSDPNEDCPKVTYITVRVYSI